MDEWDLDMQIEASYDDNSVAEMEAYEAMLAEGDPDTMQVDDEIEKTSISKDTIKDVEETSIPDIKPTSSPSKRPRPTTKNYILRVPPLDTKFIAFTPTNGERMFLRCNKEEEKVSEETTSSASSSSTTALTALEHASIEEEVRVSNRIAMMTDRINRRETRRIAIEEKEAMSSASSSSSTSSSGSSTKKARDLWVDKYGPRHFSDLLSPERTNRDVLRWIKSWDPAVFGRQGPPEIKKVNKFGNAGSWNAPKAPEETKRDPNDRSPPEYKAILLCGPPGLGKTTLAHIVAKHAGYKPFEINASDDRSKNKLLEKIKGK